MFKFVAFGNIKRVGHSFLANNCSEVKKNGALVRSFTLYRAKTNLYSTCARRRNTMTHYAQVAWKSLSQTRFCSRLTLPRTTMIAWAAGLASTRSYPVALGIYAFVTRELGWRRTFAGSGVGDLPARSTLYRHTQVGHGSLTTIFVSFFKHFLLFMRGIYLAILFSPTIAMTPFADSLGVQFRKTWLHLVLVTLEKAGPAFITWGQWAATRPDLFPRDLCVELSKCHKNGPEHSFAFTKKTIEKAFGRKLPEIFDDFEEAPLASGSVAQVHQATLRFRYSGKQVKPIAVAVKVRHPGVRESIKTDFAVIQYFAKILSFIPSLKWLKLDESLEQFAVFMTSQVDLSRKAAVLARFSHDFSRWEDVCCPKPLYPLVHPAVLVETYEKGESFSRYIDGDIKLAGTTKSTLVMNGTFTFLKMFTVDNFIYAGMRPELLRVDKGKPRAIFLDVGSTAELSPSEGQNLVELFQAVGTRDGRAAAECALRLSKKQNCPYPNAFIEDVEKSFTFWDTKEGGVINPLECMHRLLEKVRHHKLNVDGNVCTVIVSVLALEGWQRKLYRRSRYRVLQTFHGFKSPVILPMVGTDWRSERGHRFFDDDD